MARPVIIDCDPGTDDAVAIMLALALEDALELVGLTAIVGNAPLDMTVANARRICELAGRRGVPVYAGCERPILLRPEASNYLHGKSAPSRSEQLLSDIDIEEAHGVDFIIDTVLARPGEVTICCSGPLTNLALAIIKTPLVAERIREIVFFGGVVGSGAVTDSAAFNVQVDAHAASVVLASGAPVSVVGLPESARVIATPDRIKLLSALQGAVGKTLAGLLETYDKSTMKRFFSPAAPLHDPCAIAYLARPDMFSASRAYIGVETSDGPDFGRGTVDLNGLSGMSPNVTVWELISADTLVAMFNERLTRLAELTP